MDRRKFMGTSVLTAAGAGMASVVPKIPRQPDTLSDYREPWTHYKFKM
jgi:hypothetical protein